MCFYYSDENVGEQINTFTYQQDTGTLHPGTLSPLPTQFFNAKQINQQFTYNKYAYEQAALQSVSNEIDIKSEENKQLTEKFQNIKNTASTEVDYIENTFKNVE